MAECSIKDLNILGIIVMIYISISKFEGIVDSN